VGGLPKLSLELVPVTHFLWGLVQIGLWSMGSSPRAPDGVGRQRKGVCGGGASSWTFNVIGEQLQCSSDFRRGSCGGSRVSSSSVVGQARSVCVEVARRRVGASKWGKGVVGVTRDHFRGAPCPGRVDQLPIRHVIK
jgi:hypothetical protein